MNEIIPHPGPSPSRLSPAELGELSTALRRLDRGRGLVVRSAELLGHLLGGAGRLGQRLLHATPGLQHHAQAVAKAALTRAFDVAILGLTPAPLTPAPITPARRAGQRRLPWSRAVVIASGAAGGMVGMAGFLPDAAVTTLAIMRDIARIAQDEGENLADDDARRACLEVFALTPPASLLPHDASAAERDPELGYFSARLVLQGRPLVLLISEVAARYGLQLSQKFAAQLIPVTGALCGAALNNAFLAHYRELARAHFTIRRLERVHGLAAIRSAAAALRNGSVP